MAQPLHKLITSVRTNPRTPLTTIRETIARTKAEIEEQIGRRKAADRDSNDLALGEADRDEAAANSLRAGRLISAYSEAIEDLEVKLASRLESDKRKAEEAEDAAALRERDELAERFREVMPPLVKQVVELFAAIEKNAARLARQRLRVPDAEAIARGVPASFYANGGPIDQFTKMKIPDPTGPGRLWPMEHREISAFFEDMGRGLIAGREANAIARKRTFYAVEARRRTHGRYRLTGGSGFEPAVIPEECRKGNHRLPKNIFVGDRIELELSHEVAERLRAVERLTVKALATETAQ